MIKTMLAIRLIRDFIILLVVIFIGHFFVELDIIDGTLSSYLMYVGLVWFLGIILFLPFQEFPYCIFAAVFAIALFSIGVLTNKNMMQPPPLASIEEIGNHPKAKWTLFLTYMETHQTMYGYNQYDTWRFTGTTAEADNALLKLRELLQEVPNLKIIELRKELVSVPEEHARELGATTFYEGF
jgi:hypothetical protein